MAEAMEGILFTALLNGLLGLGAYWVARHGLGQPAGLPRFLAAGVIAWAWATVGMILLGSFGGLARGPLLAWVAAGAGIGFWLRRSGAEAAAAPDPGDSSWRWEGTLAVGLAIWATANLGFRSLCLPVKVMSDGPIYHLWFAARWWQEGRLFLVAAPFGETVVTYFPSGGDLWFAWLMVGWGGDLLAKVGQMPFLLLGGLAILGTARRLGIGATASAIAACWFATITSLQVFNAEPNVDTIFAAGYMLAVYFFVRYGTGGGGSEILLGALAAGLCWGTKPSGLVFVPPLLAGAGLLVLIRGGTPRRKLGHLALLGLGTAAMAGYWYAANAWRSGNPLYPLQVEPMGRRLFTGWYGREVMSLSPYYIDPADLDALADMIFQVFSPRQLPFWLAGLAGAWAIGRKRPAGQGGASGWWVAGLAALALANVAIYWLGIPYRTQQRFLFHAAALAAVPLAALLGRARWLAVAAGLVLALHTITPSAWPWADAVGRGVIPWDRSPYIPSVLPAPVILPISASEWREAAARLGGAIQTGDVRLALPVVAPILLGAGAMGLATALVGAIRAGTRRAAIRAGAAALGFLMLGGLLFTPWGAKPEQRFYPIFPDYYRGWLALDRLAGPAGSRIAYAGTNLPYYLLGPGMENRAYYVNVDEHRDWLMHDYHREAIARGEPNWPDPRPEWDRLSPDYDAWLANLRALGIDLVVVARHNPGEAWPVERAWAEGHPETFTAGYGVREDDPLFRVYRVGPR